MMTLLMGLMVWNKRWKTTKKIDNPIGNVSVGFFFVKTLFSPKSFLIIRSSNSNKNTYNYGSIENTKNRKLQSSGRL